MRKSTQGLHFAGKGSKLIVYILRITQEERTMIHITEVTTKAQLRQFVNFPIDLYRDVPQYIPGTYSDDLADWDREKNPAFSYCEARCWLASRDDGTLVGRIGAILSRKSNDKWGTHRLRFTQVDFIDRERSVIHNATYTTCQRSDEASWQPAWVLRAHLLRRLGDSSGADAALRRAIDLTTDPAERAHLSRG